ncbi:MAG: putative Ubiquitin-conjugating enzyme E2-16 kDa [Streblomastix strix]|uniref:Putative Ubiquitin-conjugating enzyme E2-16 kDa n=1 Tax=Streblomastix strix TaxID=222440 RepID=A0A5J4V950_9EUKA|nr:MAG: putative Ubiquitin-conjugating enzyme E2-16 kDa [Streblomastix strix]
MEVIPPQMPEYYQPPTKPEKPTYQEPVYFTGAIRGANTIQRPTIGQQKTFLREKPIYPRIEPLPEKTKQRTVITQRPMSEATRTYNDKVNRYIAGSRCYLEATNAVNTEKQMALRNLQNTYKKIKNGSYSEFSTGPMNENDMFHWQAIIYGPVGTPYEGGIFHLFIEFPREYPFKPPKILFTTKIYHPFILNGVIHIDILKDQWNPSLTFDKLLLMIVAMLSGPIEGDLPANIEAADLLRTNKEHYECKVRQWTQLYAMEPQEN